MQQLQKGNIIKTPLSIKGSGPAATKPLNVLTLTKAGKAFPNGFKDKVHNAIASRIKAAKGKVKASPDPKNAAGKNIKAGGKNPADKQRNSMNIKVGGY